MPDRRGVRGGIIQRYLSPYQDIKRYLGHERGGLRVTSGIPTSNDQYTAVVTIGTTAVSAFYENVDPGFDMNNLELELMLQYKMVNKLDAVGTFIMNVSAFSRSQGTTRAAIGIASYTFSVGSLATATGTLHGFIPAEANVKESPLNISVSCRALSDDSGSFSIKSASYLRMAGMVIPGT